MDKILNIEDLCYAQNILIYRLAIHVKNLQDTVFREKNCSDFLTYVASNTIIVLKEVDEYHTNQEEWLASKIKKKKQRRK